MKLSILLTLTVALAVPSCSQSPSHPSSIIGTNELEPVERFSDPSWRLRFDAVLRVFSGRALEACTGFFIAEDLVMTNSHCTQPCGLLHFEEGFEQDTWQQSLVKHPCSELLVEDILLDFAIYQVQSPISNPPTPLTFERESTNVDTPLLIASHPAGDFKKIDRSADCRAIRGPNPSSRTVYHTCDTLSGSSGSPLFSRLTGKLVGLHNRAGNGFNSAIAASSILDRLAETAPAIYARLQH